MISRRAVEAIEQSNTDELIRVIDGLCEGSGWDDLVELKGRCREAVGRGKQLWGVEEHIRYRLALEAPARWAGAAVSEGSGSLGGAARSSQAASAATRHAASTCARGQRDIAATMAQGAPRQKQTAALRARGGGPCAGSAGCDQRREPRMRSR